MRYLVFVIGLFVSTQAFALDGVIKKSHPRLFVDEHSFEKLSDNLHSNVNPYVKQLHDEEMQLANDAINDSRQLTYGDNLAQASGIVVPCVYAYKSTGKASYLENAKETVLQLCSFPDWNPAKFLDVTQGAYACALAYDWLYDELDEQCKTKILDALKRNVIEPSMDERYEKFLLKLNNWNQVCNSGVVLAALCLWDREPEYSKTALDRAIERNRIALESMYASGGVYPEGTGYMAYGTGWQLAMIYALKSSFGTDFSLSSTSGLDKAGTFLSSCIGPFGLMFDYSDNQAYHGSWPILWSLAQLYGCPDILYHDLRLSHDDKYVRDGVRNSGGLTPIYILSALDISLDSVTRPSSSIFYGLGSLPVATFRTSWEKDALFLAIKGGNPKFDHSHLDVGTFVFDAYGYRWAEEIKGKGYWYYEKNLKNRRLLWMHTQDSPRWKLLRYNNRQHNTITINNQSHCVTGYAPIVDVITDSHMMGAVVDLNNAFGGMTDKVLRTAVIEDGKRLVITDEVKSSEDIACEVLWNMATPAKATLLKDGILLEQGEIKMRVSSDNSDLSWFVETDNERAAKNAYASWDPIPHNTFFCGYMTTVPVSSTKIIRITIEKL